jgi:hypothetical protein
MLAVLALLTAFVRYAASESKGFLQATGYNNSSAGPAVDLSIEDPPLPDFLHKLGCESFANGEYVKCTGCKYDDTSVGTNHKVTHSADLSPEEAIFLMTQSGLDVFSKLQVPTGSSWEFNGVNFGTKKTPIWESTMFHEDLLKCNRKDADVMYIRRREKHPASLFLTTEGRTRWKTEHLEPNMATCYTNFALSSVETIINSMLNGMSKDASIAIQRSILKDIFFIPLLFLPELSVSESLIGATLNSICKKDCEEAIKLFPSWVKDNVLDPTGDIVKEAVDNAESKTSDMVQQSISATKIVMKSQDNFQTFLLDKLPSMSNQQILYWISRFNTSDPNGNCSLEGASKFVQEAAGWYERFAKIGLDHVGTKGHLWQSHFNGICTKGLLTGWYYVEDMIGSSYPPHVYCNVPDESKWVQIPRKWSWTALLSTNNTWSYSPAGDKCDEPRLDCHTRYGPDVPGLK